MRAFITVLGRDTVGILSKVSAACAEENISISEVTQSVLQEMFVMIMLGLMPASVVFPLISGGSIVLTYVVSRVFYNEKLSRRQMVGFIFGILSIVLLNL